MILIVLLRSFLCLPALHFPAPALQTGGKQRSLPAGNKAAVTGACSISGESPGVSVGVGRVGAWTAAAAAAGGKPERIHPAAPLFSASRRSDEEFQISTPSLPLNTCCKCTGCWLLNFPASCELCADLCSAGATCSGSNYHY